MLQSLDAKVCCNTSPRDLDPGSAVSIILNISVFLVNFLAILLLVELLHFCQLLLQALNPAVTRDASAFRHFPRSAICIVLCIDIAAVLLRVEVFDRC